MNLVRLTRLPDTLPADLRSNVIHYFFDIGWWGLYAGATAAFLTIYAARIGATPQQIGLLSAIPAGLALVFSLPSGWVVARGSAGRLTVLGAFFSRILFLGYALLPFLFSPGRQVGAILVIAALISLPATLIGVSFPQLLMEAVPAEWRGMVVGARNAIFAIVTFAVTMLSGQILTRLPFPINYQVVFFIGFVGGIMTAYHLSRVRPYCISPVAPVSPGALLPIQEAAIRRRVRLMPLVDAQGRRYIRVISLLFLFGVINNMVGPLIPEVLVHSLNLSDAWISIGTAANNLIVFGVSLFIASIVRRLGNRGGTALGAGFMALQAAALALASHPLHYLLSALAAGVGGGILNTAQFNYHLENVPETDRSVWLSWNMLLGNAALLLGTLCGPLLARYTGVPTALAGFGLLRLLMGFIILKWG